MPVDEKVSTCINVLTMIIYKFGTVYMQCDN